MGHPDDCWVGSASGLARWGGRLVRKAVRPSCLSAVAQRRPKMWASAARASSRGSSAPRWTASRTPAMARGAREAMVSARARARGRSSAAGGYFVDQADAEGFGGIDDLGGEHEAEGGAAADEAGEALGSAVAGDEAELHFGEAEAGFVAGDAEGAGEGEFAAASEGYSVDSGDYGLAGGFEVRLNESKDLVARWEAARPWRRRSRRGRGCRHRRRRRGRRCR